MNCRGSFECSPSVLLVIIFGQRPAELGQHTNASIGRQSVRAKMGGNVICVTLDVGNTIGVGFLADHKS